VKKEKEEEVGRISLGIYQKMLGVQELGCVQEESPFTVLGSAQFKKSSICTTKNNKLIPTIKQQ